MQYKKGDIEMVMGPGQEQTPTSPSQKLEEIKDKWVHSRMDYTDSKWLISRVEQLEKAIKENECSMECGTDWIKALEGMP